MGGSMVAAVLERAGGPLVVRAVARPTPGPGEVIVRVRACGLGLTLVWNRNGRHDARLPRIIGHEIAGEIAEVGPAVDAYRVGDRVAVYYYLTCGVCRWCARGRENLCEDRAGQVGREIDGGLAEYVRLPQANLCRLPDEISDVDAAISTDAIATSVHVLTARARVEADETVLVVGAGGGVGIHMVQVARMLGARVIAVDRTPEKLRLATEAGATNVVDPGRADFDAAVAELTDGRGVDVVIEMVGLEDTLRRSAASLGRGGRLVLVGSYDRDAVLAVNHGTLQGEGSVIASQYCTRAELEQTIGLVVAGRLRPMVTRLCGLDEADAVLREIESMTLAGRACVVFP
jgi:propanol-preferring alcohol dehydrogenase